MFFNYGSHHIQKEDIDIVTKTLKNGALTQKVVETFEKIVQYFDLNIVLFLRMVLQH